MDDATIYGLPLAVESALAVIVSGAVVPAVTAILAHDGLPAWFRRWFPIALSATAAVVIVLLAHPGDLSERLIGWLGIAATITGIGQAVYASMPKAWKTLEAASSPDAPAPTEHPSRDD